MNDGGRSDDHASHSTNQTKGSRPGGRLLPRGASALSGLLSSSPSRLPRLQPTSGARVVPIAETSPQEGTIDRPPESSKALTRLLSASRDGDNGDRDDPSKHASVRNALGLSFVGPPGYPQSLRGGTTASGRSMKLGENAGITIPLTVRMKAMLHEEDKVFVTQGAQHDVLSVNYVGKPAEVFHVDQCLGPTATQEEMFDYVGRQVLRHTVSGFNTTVIAYGSAGSGKTHTMLGSGTYDVEGQNAGLVARFTDDVFAQMEEKKAQGWQVACNVSFALTYASLIKDLIAPGNTDQRAAADMQRQPLGVEDAETRQVTRIPVTSAAEVHALLQEGAEARMPDSATFSVRNSLSHVIFTCRLSMTKLGVGVSRAYQTTAHFVDLASPVDEDGSIISARSVLSMTNMAVLKGLEEALVALSHPGKIRRPPSISTSSLLKYLQLGPSSKIYMIATIDPTAPPVSSARILSYATRCCGLSLDDPERGGPRATQPLSSALADTFIEEETPVEADGDADSDGSIRNSEALETDVQFMEALLRAANIDPQWSTPATLVPINTIGFGARHKVVPRKGGRGVVSSPSGDLVRTHVSRTEKTTAVELLPTKSSAPSSPRRGVPASTTPYFIQVAPFNQHHIDTAVVLFHIEENVPTICGNHVEADVQIPEGIPFACALTFGKGSQSVRVTTKMPSVWDDVLCNREYIINAWRQTRKRKLGIRVLRGGKGKNSVLVEMEAVGQWPDRGRVVRAEVEHNDVLELSKSLRYRLVVPDIVRARKQEEREKRELVATGKKSKRQEVQVDTVEVPDEGLKQRLEDKIDPLDAIRKRILTYCSTKSMAESTERFIDDLANKLNPVSAHALFIRLGRLLPLVQEANQLTSVIRPRSRLRFSIGLIENWADKYEKEPIIAIRLLKNEYYGNVRWRHTVYTKVLNKAVNPLETFDSVVAVYEIWEFRRRLFFMRAVHELAMTSGLHVATAFLAKNSQVNDPWLNFTGQETEESAIAQQERDRMREMDSIEYSSVSEQYRLLQNSLKELERENKALDKKLAVKRKDLVNLRRRLTDQITKSEDFAKQDPKVKNYQELTARMGQLGGELQQSVDSRYETEARIHRERTRWQKDVSTGAVITAEKHEERKSHAIQAAISGKKGDGFMTVEEHTRKLAKEEEVVSKWMEAHDTLRLAIETDYVARDEHEKVMQRAKEEGKKWRARAIVSAGSSDAAAKRQLEGLVVERTQRKQHP